MAKKINTKAKYSGTLTLEVLEGADKYNKWIVDSISAYIFPPVIEIGAGIGNISSLIQENKPLTLTDIDSAFIELLKKKFYQNEIKINHFDITKIPQKSDFNKYNTVIGINVLEHIEDDVQALKNLKNLLKKDGSLILLVPAKKRAYNNLDKLLGHFRRYEKKELLDKLDKTGYDISEIKFFNVLGLFTWIARDFFTGQNVHLTPRQIALFDLIVPVLKRIEKYIKMPIGISLIVVAKPKEK